MGAQTDGLKSAAFKLDTQKKASQGAARRREAIRRRTGGFERAGQSEFGEMGLGPRNERDPIGLGLPGEDRATIQPFPGPGGGEGPGYDKAKRDWYDNRKETGESFDEFGKRWRGQRPGSPWEQKEGAHILEEGRRAEAGGRGIEFGPGRADNVIDGLFPGNQAGGDFNTFRAFLAQLQNAKTGGCK